MSVVNILNLENGDTLNHSLVLIEGETDENVTKIKVIINDSRQTVEDDQLISWWPVRSGRFKALVDLQLGINEISIVLDLDIVTTLTLFYNPPNNERFIRLLYLVCNDDVYNGRFQGPVHDDQLRYTDTDAHKKITLGVKLIQTLTSECFYRMGLERRTFTLELDAVTGQPICHRFVLKSVTTAQAHKLSENQLWKLVKEELASSESMSYMVDYCKFLAFLSFTRYSNNGSWPNTHQEMLSMTKGHCSLGGGGLAVLGTGCLHTWASRVEDLVSSFTDDKTIDRAHLLDDSAYRRTYWACYATTLGAACHELGHTFGLCHTNAGIMGRGFDNTHKVFTLGELLEPNQSPAIMRSNSLNNSFINRIKLHKMMENEWQGAFWTREAALWLYYQKWFNFTQRPTNEEPEFNGTDVRARHGIRVVILAYEPQINSGDAIVKTYWEFHKGKGPLIFRLPATPEIEMLPNKKLMVIDSFGNTLNVTL